MSKLLEILAEFDSSLRISKAPATVRRYLQSLNKFVAFLEGKKVRDPQKIKESHIVDHVNAQKSLGATNTTLECHITAVKAFTKFLFRKGHITQDPAAYVPSPKREPFSPRVMTPQEIQRLLDVHDLDTEKGARDRAMIELFYSSGLRSKELAHLTPDDVSSKGVLVRSGKGSKARAVPITKGAWRAIERYLEWERPDNARVLFRSAHSTAPLSQQAIHAMVNNAAERAGLPPITVHSLRHACATHILENGGDIRLIQGILGHSTIATTQKYTHLSSLHIESMFERFHPSNS